MNEIKKKFLLVGDKLMAELDLKQPGFSYSACGPFTKTKVKIQKLKKKQKKQEIHDILITTN